MNTGADRKLLALGVKATKFTVKELLEAINTLLKALNDTQKPISRQRYESFQNPGGVPLLNVSSDQKEIKDFAEMARENHVDVSLKRNARTGTYYLTVQGNQDQMKKTALEYQEKFRQSLMQQTRLSIQAQLAQAKQQTMVHEQQSKSISRERDMGGREK